MHIEGWQTLNLPPIICIYIHVYEYEIFSWLEMCFLLNILSLSLHFYLTHRPCKITSRHISRMNISNKLYNIENSFILPFSILWQLQYLDIFLKHSLIVQLVHNVIMNREFFQLVDILFVSVEMFLWRKKKPNLSNQVQLVLKMNGIIKNLHQQSMKNPIIIVQ